MYKNKATRTRGYFLRCKHQHSRGTDNKRSCCEQTPYSVTERQVAAVNPAVLNNTPAELVTNPVRLLWLQGTTGAVAWTPNNLVLTLLLATD